MKKVLVTGGTKFLGLRLARALSERGYEVHVTGRSAASLTDLPSTIHAHTADVRDRAGMLELAQGCSYIFHLAALGNRIQEAIDMPIEIEAVNVGGTVTMLDIAREIGVEKFIFVSSAAVYGTQNVPILSEDLTPHPMDPYGLYKYFGEQLCALWESYGVPTISLRIFNLYGPENPIGDDELVIGRFLALRMRGEPLTLVGEGETTRDFIHTDDVVDALIRAAESEVHNEVLNIGSGIETSLRELAELMGGPITYVPSIEGSFAGPSRRVADISRAEELLSWRPSHSLSEGIDELKREHSLTD